MNMKSGHCENCGAGYGPDDLVCSYCGSPIRRENDTYGDINQHTYQSSNGGTQVIQNIYVNNSGSGKTTIGSVLDDAINSASHKVEQVVGTAAEGVSGSAQVSRSRLVAALLAILLGCIGLQFFYLKKVGLGILCVIFATSGIPALIGVLHGILLLKMSDAQFQAKYSV